MKKQIIFIIMIMGVVASTTAYPITPRPLRKLVIEAEVIVWGDVIRIEKVENTDGWDDTRAVLVIQEVLQGKTIVDTISVFFTPGMICPTPAHYEAGTKSLAFLRRLENKGEYTTHALSYGSKTLSEEDYQVYKARIREMQEILTITDGEEKVSQTINWLVACAMHQATRWEGVYELSPQSDFMSLYDNDLGPLVSKVPISQEQKSSIRFLLLQIDTLYYSDLGLIDLVVGEKDLEIADFLVEQLELCSPYTVWYREELFMRAYALAGRLGIKEVLTDYSKLDMYSEGFLEAADEFTLQFVEEYRAGKK